MKPSCSREPARGAGVAPPGERDRVDVDQAERGDERGRGEDRRPDPPEVTLRHRESPAEEVGGNRKQIVTHAQNDAAMRGTSVEPVLRDHAPDENDGAVGEREPIDEGRVEAQREASPTKNEDEAECEQELLPRRDDVERATADAGRPELGHREVVQRQADDEDLEDPDRAPHAGPTATSVIPRLTIRTG